MFAHIRKHQKWLFIIIITIVVIAFVIFFTPSIQYDSFGSSKRSDQVGIIDGNPVTRESFSNAFREVSLRFFFLTGQWHDRGDGSRFGFDPDLETPRRLLMLNEVEKHAIRVSDGAAAKWIVSNFRDADARNFIMTNVLERVQMSLEDFQIFAKNEIAIDQLMALKGMSGELLSPREADLLYREDALQASAQAVFFSSENYADLNQELTGLETFYTNRMALYRTPAKRDIHYVKFAATNYLEQAEAQMSVSTNLTEMARLIYDEKGTNAFTENGIVLSEEEALLKIKNDELERIGLVLAKKDAFDFARELFDIEPMRAESLIELAESKGYVPERSESFSGNQLIPKIRVPYSLTRQVFQLSEEEPFTSPFITADAVYIISLGDIFPSTIPPLDEIRSRVIVDFYQERSLEAAREAARAFHKTLKSEMEGGRQFEEICDEAGYERNELPLFSQNTQNYSGDPRADLGTLKGTAFALGAGEISEVISNREGAMLLFVNDFVEVLEEDVRRELPDYIENLRQNRRGEASSEWLAESMKTMHFPSIGRNEADDEQL